MYLLLKSINPGKYYLLIIISCIMLMGCKKILQIDVPNNKIIGSEMFKDDAAATSTVLGIYSSLSGTSNLLSGSTTIYPAMYADEIKYTGTENNIMEFYYNSILPDNKTIGDNFWKNAYQFIYHANYCLEQITNNKALTPATAYQLTGECKFLRALLYFYLIHLFGEVPLVMTTDYTISNNIGRTDMAVIKQQILDDLISAKQLLSEDYPDRQTVRVNRWAAIALLARFYLYQGNWAEADNQASEVISSGLFHLESNPGNVFLLNSKEAIFQLPPVLDGYNTMEGATLLPEINTRPSFELTVSMLNSFEPKDKRKAEWVGNTTPVNGITYYYPAKYKQRSNFLTGFKLTEYTTVLRLAELYLIRAESRAKLGLLPEAIQDLDSIRNRAGLPLIALTSPGISETDLLAKIQKERRVELFAEWGHRWFDLKRTCTADQILKLKPGWNITDTLLPIPGPEILLNPALTQNSGYN